jgi:hypothetical protein
MLMAGMSGARPLPGGPPVPLAEVVVAACNNTFSPAKFPLTFDITSTVTAPVDSDGNAEIVTPGDAFTMDFTVTANLAASFKAAAYALIGPRPVTVSEARATIGVQSGATGPILSVGSGVTNGFEVQTIPAPGRSVTVTFTEESATVVASPGAFEPDDVGRQITDLRSPSATAGGRTIASVASDGSSATMSAPALEDGAAISAQVWSPQELTDSAVPLGSVSGTYTAGSEDVASFILLGNATYAGGGAVPADAPAGYSSNSTTNDPRAGTAVVPNTTTGFGSTVSTAARQTYLQVTVIPGVSPYLPCMSGSWTETGSDPAYAAPYVEPAGFAKVTVAGGAPPSSTSTTSPSSTSSTPTTSATSSTSSSSTTVPSTSTTTGSGGQSFTQLVAAACNNTFAPTKFPLDYRITATPTKARVESGESFDVTFTVTMIATASFLNGVYELLGPVEIPITSNRVTIGPAVGVTGTDVQSVMPGTFAIPAPAALPVAVAAEVPIGNVTGSYTSTTSGAIAFRVVGNAWDPTDTLPDGVNEPGWTGAGANAVLTASGSKSAARASLAGGVVQPWLVCMGGAWTQGSDGDWAPPFTAGAFEIAINDITPSTTTTTTSTTSPPPGPPGPPTDPPGPGLSVEAVAEASVEVVGTSGVAGRGLDYLPQTGVLEQQLLMRILAGLLAIQAGYLLWSASRPDPRLRRILAAGGS